MSVSSKNERTISDKPRQSCQREISRVAEDFVGLSEPALKKSEQTLCKPSILLICGVNRAYLYVKVELSYKLNFKSIDVQREICNYLSHFLSFLTLVTLVTMGFKKVTHVLFDLDGLLIGRWCLLVILQLLLSI